jgi:hypothetical protein
MPSRLEAGAGWRDLPGPSDTTVRGRNTVDQPQLPCEQAVGLGGLGIAEAAKAYFWSYFW